MNLDYDNPVLDRAIGWIICAVTFVAGFIYALNH